MNKQRENRIEATGDGNIQKNRSNIRKTNQTNAEIMERIGIT